MVLIPWLPSLAVCFIDGLSYSGFPNNWKALGCWLEPPLPASA